MSTDFEGIEVQRDPKIVLASLGSTEAGTFKGSMRLDIDGTVAYIANVYVEPDMRQQGLATALFDAAIRELSAPPSVVHAHIAGWEGDRLVESLQRTYPDIRFVKVDDD